MMERLWKCYAVLQVLLLIPVAIVWALWGPEDPPYNGGPEL